ncbi:peptide ABC transporter ATP-binding protein [Curtobacterium sp. MCJR17_055]|uniref:ABC transporter ATP-binding protein n=1 Tax=unclassified Curtobacterium TaxID=257496 RepID=UPI000D8DCD6E|nr:MULTISPECIES: ATP-binding cassette domain-containing protein [unclassified Curtobacterium]PYY36820.1 peptide ABC transporter ATP-binding protein [Curtobacterium sp. MCBD17_029]PYY49672.1 peptide ABC transporter ATP-binding protein [Curtobacterium sp. MCBD17_023]PYY58069.1 peptide ABC transporter ATP-binding protein [Curtobacterium sp. MCPF17_015]PYY58519.1 peptide ABC transporter ATP-binding protein [Curtobacterium sp. MCJR17_055]
MTALLELSDVTFRYPGRGTRRTGGTGLALDGVSFAVQPGEHLGIVGESGAGKTTVLRMLLGLAAPDSGSVSFDGAPLDLGDRAALRRFRTAVQPVFQDPYSSLDPRQRIDRIVGEPLRSLGVASGSEASDRVAAALRDVGLGADAGRRYPHEFSGGQRQRIAIARAVVSGPRVLVADEPVSALDLTTRVAVLELFERLAEEHGMTIVLVSHDLAVVARLCAATVVLRGGRVEEQGDTGAVLASPRSDYTRALLDAVPRLPR